MSGSERNQIHNHLWLKGDTGSDEDEVGQNEAQDLKYHTQRR